MQVKLFNADGKFTTVQLNDDKSRVCGNEEKGTNCVLRVLEIVFPVLSPKVVKRVLSTSIAEIKGEMEFPPDTPLVTILVPAEVRCEFHFKDLDQHGDIVRQDDSMCFTSTKTFREQLDATSLPIELIGEVQYFTDHPIPLQVDKLKVAETLPKVEIKHTATPPKTVQDVKKDVEKAEPQLKDIPHKPAPKI